MDHWRKEWTCPFFKHDGRRRVVCEGGSVLTLPDKQGAAAFMDRHCADLDGWRRCSVARARMEYYDRKEAPAGGQGGDRG